MIISQQEYLIFQINSALTSQVSERHENLDFGRYGQNIIFGGSRTHFFIFRSPKHLFTTNQDTAKKFEM